MHNTLIEPDATAATRYRHHLEGIVRDDLRALCGPLELDDEIQLALDDASPEDDTPLYPGVFAACHQLHRHRNIAGRPAEGASIDTERAVVDRLSRELVDYQTRRQRSRQALDGSPGARYPELSLDRALCQAPSSLDRARISAGLAPWSSRTRATLSAALHLLAEVWPEAHDEVRVLVADLWLLSGGSLVGFTDFAAHGAIFVNVARLADGDGLPAEIRCAESLLHETTHTLCNAAAVADPLLVPSYTEGVAMVPTPLRADDRPLAGLLQQLVVLVRCAELYVRLTPPAGGPDPIEGSWSGPGVAARRTRLAAQAEAAASTLLRHRGHLTDAGRALLAVALSAR